MENNIVLSDYSGSKVLVTGGAGFIGSNIVKCLIEFGAIVTVLDDLYTGDYNNICHLSIKEFIKGDVRDEDLIKKIVSSFDFIFHLAARNIIISTNNPIEDYSVNIGGTLNMLIHLRNSKSLNRFVYSSSVSIYGNPKYLPINEDDAYNLLSPYAVSKLSGENYTYVFYENFNTPTTIVRYSNVYGINQSTNNPYCGVIGKIIEKIIQNESPLIHGDGEQTRDFTYIKDVVEATLLAGISKRAIGEIFNIGTGIETSINELVNIVNELLGKNIQANYIDRRDIDNIRRRVINIEKARKSLRWIPQYTLKKGLRETIDWNRSL